MILYPLNYNHTCVIPNNSFNQHIKHQDQSCNYINIILGKGNKLPIHNYKYNRGSAKKSQLPQIHKDHNIQIGLILSRFSFFHIVKIGLLDYHKKFGWLDSRFLFFRRFRVFRDYEQ